MSSSSIQAKMEEAVQYLLDILLDPLSNLKKEALSLILSFVTSEEGIQFIIAHPEFVPAIVAVTAGEPSAANMLAHKCLLNIAASPVGVKIIFEQKKDWFVYLLEALRVVGLPYLDLKCNILVNATRCEDVCKWVVDHILQQFQVFTDTLTLFNSHGSATVHDYDTLAMFYGNLARDYRMRRMLETEGLEILKALSSYTVYPHCEKRRYGIAIMLKNILFDLDFHNLLLDEGILSPLLLPLIGPEEFDEDEMEKLPIACQYLGAEKSREPQSRIRIVLLEALLRLCVSRYGRNFLRDNGAYYVLRELHKCETVPSVIKVCEEVVEILIREESDINADNLMDLEIPAHLSRQLGELSLTCGGAEAEDG